MNSAQIKFYGRKNTKTIIVLGGWKTTQSQLWLLGKLLTTYNFQVIIFTWDENILVPSSKKTLSNFMEAKKIVRKTIDSLSKKERAHLSIFAMSLGTVIAGLIAHETRIDKIILNVGGADTSEIIWSWDSIINGFKNKLAKQTPTLTQLKKVWAPLSTLKNLEKSQTRQILIYLSQKDELIPYREQERLVTGLIKAKIRTEAYVNKRHSHLISIIINLLRFPIYLGFLKRPTQKQVQKNH